MFFMSSLISLLGVLLSVAFFTLMERKIMGIMHYRKGPNKVLLGGITQPMADAVKLLSKENMKVASIKKTMFLVGPSLALVLMMACWSLYPPQQMTLSESSKPLFMALSFMGISAFVFFFMGWGSNSKYALMGSYRAVSQIISYEVCLFIFILSLSYTQNSFSFNSFSLSQENWGHMMLSLPLFMCWVMMCLSESNRTPFDHAESESELVSGFNVEYGGGLFAIVFIAEYGMIMFLSFLTTIMFLGGSIILMKTFFICVLYIWTRCSLPRLRYDKLMFLCWKICLPYTISILCLTLCI